MKAFMLVLSFSLVALSCFEYVHDDMGGAVFFGFASIFSAVATHILSFVERIKTFPPK